MTVCQEAKFGSKLDFGTIKISIIRYVIILHSTYQEDTTKKVSIQFCRLISFNHGRKEKP